MSTRLFGAMMLVVAATGCRMCSDSCDYGPTLIGGPYEGVQGRAGSVLNEGLVDGAAADAAEPVAPMLSPTPPPPPPITQPEPLAP